MDFFPSPSEPIPGNWRPGSRVKFADDQPFPFSYCSDLHWLWGWGARIHSLLGAERKPSGCDRMIFRPDTGALNAMMRFSVKYPHVIKQVDDYLDFLEKQWTKFSDDGYNPDASHADNFCDAMSNLTERIRVACETIAAAELLPPDAPDSANCANHSALFPNGVPKDSDIVDLVVRLNSEHAKAKTERKSDNEVAREFTNEPKGGDVKAKRLLARIRKMKRKGDIIL